MNVTLDDLKERWLDSVWAMLVAAYDGAEVDASDVPGPHMLSIEQNGVDAWLAEIYPQRIKGRVTFMGVDVNKLLDNAELDARVYVCARDQGLQAAMLMKLSHNKGDTL